MWGSLRAMTQQMATRGAARKTLQQQKRSFAITTVNVPSMGDSISEGTLVQIVKAAGETVHADEVVAILETDKVSVDVMSPVAGTIVEHLAKLEENVEVGRALFSVDDSRAPEPGSKAAPSQAAAPTPVAPVAAAAAAASGHRVPSIKFLGKRSLLPAKPSPLTKPAARHAPPPLAPVQPSGPNVLPFNHVKRAPLTPAEVDAINSGIAFLREPLSEHKRLHAHHRRRAENVVLRARAAADRPLAALRHAALLAAAVRLAVAAAAVRLGAALGLAAAAAAVADAFATAVGFALAAWHIAGLRAAVGLAQSAVLAQTLASLHRAARLAAMRTAPIYTQNRAHLFLGAIRDGALVPAAMREAVASALVVLVAAASRAALACAAVVLAPAAIQRPVGAVLCLAPLAAAMELAAAAADTRRVAAFHVALLAAAMAGAQPAALVFLRAAFDFAEVPAAMRLALALSAVVLLAPFLLAARAAAMAAAHAVADLLLRAPFDGAVAAAAVRETEAEAGVVLVALLHRALAPAAMRAAERAHAQRHFRAPEHAAALRTAVLLARARVEKRAERRLALVAPAVRDAQAAALRKLAAAVVLAQVPSALAAAVHMRLCVVGRRARRRVGRRRGRRRRRRRQHRGGASGRVHHAQELLLLLHGVVVRVLLAQRVVVVMVMVVVVLVRAQVHPVVLVAVVLPPLLLVELVERRRRLHAEARAQVVRLLGRVQQPERQAAAVAIAVAAAGEATHRRLVRQRERRGKHGRVEVDNVEARVIAAEEHGGRRHLLLHVPRRALLCAASRQSCSLRRFLPLARLSELIIGSEHE